MDKICCVEDADVYPNTSSCSMVLRSACSHRHSRESSTVKEHSHSSSPSRKSKCTSTVSKNDSCNGSLHLQSSLESSLKQLGLKSTENTYSILKGQFYDSFEISKSARLNIFESSLLNVSCAKEFHFSQLPGLNGSYIAKKLSNSDYSSASESDTNSSELLSSASNMSGSHRLTRSSVSSMRSLSESDEEVDKVEIPRSKRNSVNTYDLRLRNISSHEESNNSQSSRNSSFLERHTNRNSHLNIHTGISYDDNQHLHTKLNDSSHLDRSSLQYSRFDRFRWFLWRCTYLKIIKCVNFDVWFLSRLNNWGKLKAVMFLLLPLLLFLVWGVYQRDTREQMYEIVSSAMSSFLAFISSMFSSIFSFFVQQEEETTSDTSDLDIRTKLCNLFSPFLSSLSGFFTIFSGWITRNNEIDYSMEKTEYHSKEPLYHQDEEINLLNNDQSLTKEFNSLTKEVNSLTREEVNLLTREEVNLLIRKEINSLMSKEVNSVTREEVHSLIEKEVHSLNREEVKVLASEVLKEEVNSLKVYLKSIVQGTNAIKLEKDQKLQNEITDLHLEFQTISRTMEKLQNDIKLQSEKSEQDQIINAQMNDYKSHIDLLSMKLGTIETKLSILERLKSCCDKQWSQEDLLALLEKHLILAFKSIVGGDSDLQSKYHFFNEWFNEKLMQEINAALRGQQSSSSSNSKVNIDNVIQVVESTVSKHVDSIKRNISAYSSYNMQDLSTEDKVKKIVKEAIMLYDADKTGQVDYALESGGGSILGTRCSETYAEKYGKVSIFGVPLWTYSNSPRTAIQPDVQPGRCWAFKGSQGFLVIGLSAVIYPTGFTLEHIPVSLSPSGSIDSAPKEFSVWGLNNEKDSKGIKLGNYIYDINGEPLQYFTIQESVDKPYAYIELQIHSNHGNMEFTCLYRFRVHGQRVR